MKILAFSHQEINILHHMITIHLSQKTKEELESRHKCSCDKQESDRIKAVLLCHEGWSLRMIAQALHKHEASIARHLNDYIEHDKLKSENGGSEGYLNEAQTKAVIQHLTEVTYLHQHQIAAFIKIDVWG